METSNLFGIAAAKQETEDETSDGDKDVSGSKHAIFSIENEANLFATSPGISPDCIANSKHLQLELNTDGDKDLSIVTSCEKDVSQQRCGTPCMPDLINVCLKQEMIVDCQENELPRNIYAFAENDMVKQEICRTVETSFEDTSEKALLKRSHPSDHQRTPIGRKFIKWKMSTIKSSKIHCRACGHNDELPYHIHQISSNSFLPYSSKSMGKHLEMYEGEIPTRRTNRTNSATWKIQSLLMDD
ncbi:hypothetical protein QYM36_016545 [Artemia franciscana]|uniref:Uncharacterized protein n=1 Tax=Artemia franciscana TaxID=6661 RepID=A0AA88HA68_ARTSF|nr:hypothetical protein QYM36_016545 [Artemia franciscana]